MKFVENNLKFVKITFVHNFCKNKKEKIFSKLLSLGRGLYRKFVSWAGLLKGKFRGLGVSRGGGGGGGGHGNPSY